MYLSRFAGLTSLLALACGGSTPPAEIPPIDSDPSLELGQLPDDDFPTMDAFIPEDGGPLVRLGSTTLEPGDGLSLEGAPCEEVVAYVVRGRIQDGGAERLAGTLIRTQDSIVLEALEPSELVVSINRPESFPFGAADCAEAPSDDVTVSEPPVLSNADGKLRVQIFLDANNGGRFGSFAILDGDADLSVPEHVHETSAEVLLIQSGDGQMLLGDETFQLEPGRVVYVPADTTHGYTAGTAPLRAIQVYAGPGPEQRFRSLSASWQRARLATVDQGRQGT